MIGFVYYPINACSQDSTGSIKPRLSVNIGDKLPDLTIAGFFDKKHPVTKLSKLYKKGGLIINFWATWCAPCIAELPVLNKLAQKYSSKLSVLSVEYESSHIVSGFLKQHPEINISDLNLIAGDTLLVKHLKHRSLPYNVWIDSLGIVRHITHGDEINESNIKRFVSGQTFNTSNAKDRSDFGFDKPFHYKDSAFIYRSIVTGHTDGIPSGYNFLSTTVSSSNWKINRIYVFNVSISQLYKIAFSKMISNASVMDFYNRIEFYTNDSIRYFPPKLNSTFYTKSNYSSRDEWASDNTYCYDLTLPVATDANIAFNQMFDDLQRTFHLHAKIEKKLKPCTVISLTDQSKKRLFKPSLKDTSQINITKDGIYTQNNELVFLFENLNTSLRPSLDSIPLDPPYINETGIDYPTDLSLDLKIDKSDYKQVKEKFKEKYGLKFTLEMREVPVLVIKNSD
jgi:thiol-disulfide isomerase/thioredoxin